MSIFSTQEGLQILQANILSIYERGVEIQNIFRTVLY